MFHLCTESRIEVALEETTKTTFQLGFLITLYFIDSAVLGVLRKTVGYKRDGVRYYI